MGSGASHTRVVIADDHTLLRDGLKRLLTRRGISVVGEASDGASTMKEVVRAKPDLLLLDLCMPNTEPCSLIAEACASLHKLRVVAMTGYPTVSKPHAALAAGAAGVVLKDSGLERLLDAIARVRQGRMYVDPDLPVEQIRPHRQGLTEREHVIMVELARGATYRQIGRLLHLSERTIETYRRRIAGKLGVRTRAELTSYALEQGLLATTS